MATRTWFITGISSGFGRIMTEQLLAHGDGVAGTLRDLSAVQALKARYGDQPMIASVDQKPAPRQLALGSDAYTMMRVQRSARFEALEGQRELACSTDAEARPRVDLAGSNT